VQMKVRVRAALRLKKAQELSALRHARPDHNSSVETAPVATPPQPQYLLGAVVTKLLESRRVETAGHIKRLQAYACALAEAAASLPQFSETIDQNFVLRLRECIPFHDIGMLSLPDHILYKQGKLTAEERLFMQAHPALGAEVLQGAAQGGTSHHEFLDMAVAITQHHHERMDGTGYPDGLAGDKIPLAARLVALADVYDALRAPRSYKPALSHVSTLQILQKESPGQFDPALLSVLPHCAARWESIYREWKD